MMKRLNQAAVFAAVLVMTAATADAGWVITDADGSETLISDGKMRGEWETGTVIFHADSKQLYMVDDMRRIYASGTIEEICLEMKEFVDGMMEDMPEEQREMVRKMMGHQEAPKVTIAEKGSGEEMSGFDTRRYDVVVNGELWEQLWITNDRELVKECGPVMKGIAEFARCMASLDPMAGTSDPEASPEYAKVFEHGVVLKSVRVADQEEGIAPEMTMVARRDVASNLFNVPDGYRSVPFTEMMGVGGE